MPPSRAHWQGERMRVSAHFGCVLAMTHFLYHSRDTAPEDAQRCSRMLSSGCATPDLDRQPLCAWEWELGPFPYDHYRGSQRVTPSRGPVLSGLGFLTCLTRQRTPVRFGDCGIVMRSGSLSLEFGGPPCHTCLTPSFWGPH